MEFTHHVLDLSDEELEQFDDGDYYTTERGNDGWKSAGYLALVFIGIIAALMTGEYWLAVPGILLNWYHAVELGVRQSANKRARLRTVAQIMVDEELARQAEEEMI